MFGGELLESSIGYRKWFWYRVEIKWWIVKYLKRLSGSKRERERERERERGCLVQNFHHLILKFHGPHLKDACLVQFFYLNFHDSLLKKKWVKSHANWKQLLRIFKNWKLSYGIWVMGYEWWVTRDGLTK